MKNVPKISQKLCWTNENGQINIIMKNKGIMNFLLQKIMNKPQKTIVSLDETGSFIWKKIDGKKTIEEIALEVEKKFGNAAMPVYERLNKYLSILCEYKFIILTKENSGLKR